MSRTKSAFFYDQYPLMYYPEVTVSNDFNHVLHIAAAKCATKVEMKAVLGKFFVQKQVIGYYVPVFKRLRFLIRECNL